MQNKTVATRSGKVSTRTAMACNAKGERGQENQENQEKQTVGDSWGHQGKGEHTALEHHQNQQLKPQGNKTLACW